MPSSEFVLQLYARPEEGVFTEEKSVRQPVDLKLIASAISLHFPGSVEEPIKQVRLDFADQPSRFVLHDLLISADNQVLWEWDHTITSLPKLHDLVAQPLGDAVLMEGTSEDPFVTIDLPQPIGGPLQVSVRVSKAACSDAGPDQPPGHADLKLAGAFLELQYGISRSIDGLTEVLVSLQQTTLSNHFAIVAKEREREDNFNSIAEDLGRAIRSADETGQSLLERNFQSAEAIKSTLEGEVVSRLVQLCELGAQNAGSLKAELEEKARLLSHLERTCDEVRIILGVDSATEIAPAVRKLQDDHAQAAKRVTELEATTLARMRRALLGEPASGRPGGSHISSS